MKEFYLLYLFICLLAPTRATVTLAVVIYAIIHIIYDQVTNDGHLQKA